MGRLCFHWFSVNLLMLSSLLLLCVGDDGLVPGRPISVNQTITSSGGIFALGFFSPGNTTGNSYIGIWYSNSPKETVVWVANREAPVKDPSTGVLAVMADGNVAVLDGSGGIRWSTNLSGIPSNTSAVLLDSGNFVLRDGEGNDLWQSFDHPTDTYLPSMHLRLDFETRAGTKLLSWRDPLDPSPGGFSFGLDPKSPVQAIMRNGSGVIWRGWPWDGRLVIGDTNSVFIQHYTLDEQGISVTYTTSGVSGMSRYVLGPSGRVEFLYSSNKGRSWSVLVSQPSRPCEIYARCGAFGYCELDVSQPDHPCKCPQEFEPMNRKEWEMGNFSGGCARRRPLALDGGDVFIKLDAMKVADNSTVSWNTSAAQCRADCLGNEGCVAYAFANVTAGDRVVGSKCLSWEGELKDLLRRANTPGEGQGLYVRVAASDPVVGAEKDMTLKKKILPMIIVPTIAIGMLVMATSCYVLRRRLIRQEARMPRMRELMDENRLSKTLASESDSFELTLLDFKSIMVATNNFSIENQLGQGGFGHVYKGNLFQGYEVAIKRLSKCSGQGFEEFANEVKLIAKLQHKNLVRLLGWCNHEEEKILVYEYMPNGSLDKFIFDPKRAPELDWDKRLKIIQGIANGLLYLHEYSRLRVIHRDLKTSNILLDAIVNPKISDFGLARIFDGNQTEANTERVVGTYGYMSPEYALDGLFSEKSDVFSFGVMLLEIVTGKKTTGFYPYKDSLNLLGYVWQMWKEGQSLELIDPLMGQTFTTAEVSKCIQVGLLCIQEDANDRPSMSSIVFMLRKENTALPSPKQPAFAIKKKSSPLLTTSTSSTSQEHVGE